MMFRTQYTKPVSVCLWAMWTLAAVLVAAAIAVAAASSSAAPAPVARQAPNASGVKFSEFTASSSMLRESRIDMENKKPD